MLCKKLLWIITRTVLFLVHEFFLCSVCNWIWDICNSLTQAACSTWKSNWRSWRRCCLSCFLASLYSWSSWRCANLSLLISIIDDSSDCCWCCLLSFLVLLPLLNVLQELLVPRWLTINCLSLAVSIPRNAVLSASALANHRLFQLPPYSMHLGIFKLAEYTSYKSSSNVCTLFDASSSSLYPLQNGTLPWAFAYAMYSENIKCELIIRVFTMKWPAGRYCVSLSSGRPWEIMIHLYPSDSEIFL